MKRVAMAMTVAIMFAAGSAPAQESFEVKTATKQGVGTYLVDANGKALYWFTKDSAGKSTCAGPCVEKWPVYYCETITTPPGLPAKDFSSITRADGQKQSAFRGFPLYYWAGDAEAGDTKGQGVNSVWYVIDPSNFPPKKAGW